MDGQAQLDQRMGSAMNERKADKSLDELSQEAQPSLIVEFLEFLRDNKKWWLLPILLVIAAVGLLAAFASSGAAPFIYTLF
jgi:membrane-bound ClpP family serine protease